MVSTAQPPVSEYTGEGGMVELIAYGRVSTDRQGASGLGLVTPREAVARVISAGQSLGWRV
jgi:hypothetical protein